MLSYAQERLFFWEANALKFLSGSTDTHVGHALILIYGGTRKFMCQSKDDPHDLSTQRQEVDLFGFVAYELRCGKHSVIGYMLRLQFLKSLF